MPIFILSITSLKFHRPECKRIQGKSDRHGRVEVRSFTEAKRNWDRPRKWVSQCRMCRPPIY